MGADGDPHYLPNDERPRIEIRIASNDSVYRSAVAEPQLVEGIAPTDRIIDDVTLTWAEPKE